MAMAGVKVFGCGNGSLVQNSKCQPLMDSLFLSGSGSRSMMSFEDGGGSSRPLFGSYGFSDDGMIDEDLEEYFQEHQPGKKRRLSVDQVQFLEKSFEVENKLEPERKVQLAKELGLQPRQVAIWFQNRRARWKTKQMEKDYDVLQASFNGLKSDYESLLKETEKLKAEVLNLSEKLSKRDTEKENPEASENSNKLSEEPTQKLITESEGEVSKVSAVEDISSGKSDIFDSDSPRFSVELRSNPVPDNGDSDLDEEDNLSRNFLPPYTFPKLEDVDYSDEPASSCNFGFPVEDHAFWSWSY